MSLRTSQQTGVAISWTGRKPQGIATSGFALLAMTVINESEELYK